MPEMRGTLFFQNTGGRYSTFDAGSGASRTYANESLEDLALSVVGHGAQVAVTRGYTSYSSGGAQTRYSIALLDVVSGNRVAEFGSFVGFGSVPPEISPDGMLAAVDWRTSDESKSDIHLRVIDRQARIVADLPGAGAWAWTPDARLLLVRDDGGMYITDRHFGNERRITNFEGSLLPGQLRVSPDGKNVAFVWQNHIWLVGIDGTNLRQLTNSNLGERAPAWSPDGKSLAFLWGNQVATYIDASCPELYVTSAAAHRVTLPADIDKTVWRVKDSNQTPLCSFGQLDWR